MRLRVIRRTRAIVAAPCRASCRTLYRSSVTVSRVPFTYPPRRMFARLTAARERQSVCTCSALTTWLVEAIKRLSVSRHNFTALRIRPPPPKTKSSQRKKSFEISKVSFFFFFICVFNYMILGCQSKKWSTHKYFTKTVCTKSHIVLKPRRAVFLRGTVYEIFEYNTQRIRRETSSYKKYTYNAWYAY